MGLDAERFPPFRTTVFNKAYARTGYDRPVQIARTRRRCMSILLVFSIGSSRKPTERGLTLRHRLDAQSVVWGVMGDFWEIQKMMTASETEDQTQTNP